MKLGIDTFSYHISLAAGIYDLFSILDRFEGLGLSGLQININGPNGRFLGGDPTDTAHLRKVRRVIESKGFFLEIGGSGTDPAKLKWQLDLASKLGADVLRTLLVFRGSTVETFRRTTREIESVLPLARKLGVRVAFENHEDVTARELRAFLDEVDSEEVGACLDTGNDLVVYGDPLEAASLLAPVAISTHIKDQKLIRVGDTVFSVGVPLGEGDLPLPEQLRAIVESGSLNRLLLQDTTGYAARLNRFERPDLVARGNYAGLPGFRDSVEAMAAGYILDLADLSSEELKREADREDARIVRDMKVLRELIDV